MRDTFALTERSNVIILKMIKSFLFVTILLICIDYFKHFSTDLLYLMLVVGFVGLILLFSLKSYKVVGKIIFESNLVTIESNAMTIQLAFNTIRRIKLMIRGRRRRSYWPVIYQPIGVNMANGTGNTIEIETDDHIYILDIFLENSFDENSLEYQIKRLADSGVKIDKRKLPAILGDTI